MPNFAHFSHSGRENSSLRSRVMTSSLSSSRANRRTSLRKAACSSFHAKSKACYLLISFWPKCTLSLVLCRYGGWGTRGFWRRCGCRSRCRHGCGRRRGFLYEPLWPSSWQLDAGWDAHDHHVVANIGEYQAVRRNHYVAADFCIAHQLGAGAEVNVVANSATGVRNQASGRNRKVFTYGRLAQINRVHRMDHKARTNLRVHVDVHAGEQFHKFAEK